MSAEENRKILEQFYAASNSGDMITELVSPVFG